MSKKKGFCKAHLYISGKKKTKETVGPLLSEMGDLVTQNREKSEVLNVFFTSARPKFLRDLAEMSV